MRIGRDTNGSHVVDAVKKRSPPHARGSNGPTGSEGGRWRESKPLAPVGSRWLGGLTYVNADDAYRPVGFDWLDVLTASTGHVVGSEARASSSGFCRASEPQYEGALRRLEGWERGGGTAVSSK